jgi:hypothetical protein
VKDALNALPATLDETYARMLERIAPANRGDANILLRWLAYAMRPPTLAELTTVVTISPEDDEVAFCDEGDLRDLLSILMGLVILSDDVDLTREGRDEEHNVASMEAKALKSDACIRLAHFSVKEYLESARISGSSARFLSLEAGVCHRFLAQSCLTYLMHYSRTFGNASTRQDYNEYPLLKYAASRWFEHSRLQSGVDVSRELALLLCEKARVDWLRIHELYLIQINDDEYIHEANIHYAVSLGLHHVAEGLLKAGEDANSVGSDGTPLLVIATKQ